MFRHTITIKISTRAQFMDGEMFKIANHLTMEAENRMVGMGRVGPATRSYKTEETPGSAPNRNGGKRK